MHPNGQLPAYEWAFDDVNPPVHGWAALRVFELDGARDFDFLERVLHKLLMNFTWWVNRKDSRRQQRLRGRLPRAGQRRPVRPGRGAAGGRRAGAERRHRLDGDVRAQHARDEPGARASAIRPMWTSRPSSSSTSPTSRRPPTSRACGTTEDGVLLRRDPPGRRREGAAEGALGGRPAAAGGDDDPVLGDAEPAAGGRRTAALVPRATSPSTPTRSAPGASATASSNVERFSA